MGMVANMRVHPARSSAHRARDDPDRFATPPAITMRLQISTPFAPVTHANREAGVPISEGVRPVGSVTDQENPGRPADLAVALKLLAEDAHRPALRTRAIAGGHRAFDTPHVADARLVAPREFFSFAAKQLRLAKAAGLSS